MGGLQAGMLFTQQSIRVPLAAHTRCWQLAAARPVRQQRMILSIRSAASETATASQEETATETVGVKSKLFKILRPVQDPITAEELWPLAEAEGLKSKRFMKSMLNDLRRRGKISTKPARGKSFGYILPEQWASLNKQARQAAVTEESGGKSTPSKAKA